MSRTAKIVVGTTVSILLILIAGIIILRHIVTKSFPQTSGTIRVAGLHSPVDVYRDDYGVPHIEARDEHDLMFAAGYIHAQDRLWQMDMMRRAGEGRLSEIMGGGAVNMDKLFRTLDFRGIARRIKERLHPDSRRVLEDYADGVNSFIDTHKGKYPIEFDMMNCEPEHWTVDHSLLLDRLMAWELNLAWWTDLTYGEIAARVTPEKLQEILPVLPDSVPALAPSTANDGKLLQEIHGVLAVARSYRAVFELGNLGAGSNAWVVDSSKSFNGKPLLANDPHLALSQPARWYEMHLTAPGINVAGMSLPGAPLIIIGHNEHIAWGLANAMLDDADFFIEQVDSTNPARYRIGGMFVPFETREEKIYIRPSDSVTITIRSTHHGPVVSDVHSAFLHSAADSSFRRKVISMRWAGLDVSDEVRAFYLMDKATNYREFEEGVRQIAVPALSVVYADVAGNIAYWMTGRVPIRGKGNPMLPLSGETNETDWRDMVPFDQLPKLLNPPGGIIACANQRIADKNYPHYLSTLWEPPSRIQRIRQLLQSADKFTADDFKQLQQDVVSPYAQEIMPHILAAYDTVPPENQKVADALDYLRNWDYRFTATDIAATIFNGFFVRLLHNTYEDEMGSDVFNDFLFFNAIPYRVTAQLLARDSSSWFDDVRTPQVESKNDIIRKSLTEAINELQATLGTEMKTWQWGNVHTVTFRHSLGTKKPLDQVFNIGPFPVAGGGTTINLSSFNFQSPYSTTVGPSMREVVDLAHPLVAFTVITTGQSGQALQKHYGDQTSLWLTGGYKTVSMDWDEIHRDYAEHLTLKP